MSATDGTEVLTGYCECGTEVVREIPAEYRGRPFFETWRDAPFVCDACIHAEYVREEAERQQRRAEEKFWWWLKNSGLPRSRQVGLETLDHPDEVLEACWDWVENGRGLMLTGEVGRGKTTLAGGAVFAMLRRRPVTWTSMPELFAKLAKAHDHPDRAWALDVVTGDEALALDDLDKARDTDYGIEQVFLAVDRRVEHEIPLVVTSNLTPAGLAARYGDAVASRLVGYCRVVPVQGVDRRLSR